MTPWVCTLYPLRISPQTPSALAFSNVCILARHDLCPFVMKACPVLLYTKQNPRKEADVTISSARHMSTSSKYTLTMPHCNMTTRFGLATAKSYHAHQQEDFLQCPVSLFLAKIGGDVCVFVLCFLPLSHGFHPTQRTNEVKKYAIAENVSFATPLKHSSVMLQSMVFLWRCFTSWSFQSMVKAVSGACAMHELPARISCIRLSLQAVIMTHHFAPVAWS